MNSCNFDKRNNSIIHLLVFILIQLIWIMKKSLAQAMKFVSALAAFTTVVVITFYLYVSK